MKYFALGTSNNLNQSLTKDTNGNDIIQILASENFTSAIFDVYDRAEILIITTGITGNGGSLKYQKSLDGINFVDVEKNDVAVTIAVATNFVETIEDYRGLANFRRFVYTKGNVTAGNIVIKTRSL